MNDKPLSATHAPPVHAMIHGGKPGPTPLSKPPDRDTRPQAKSTRQATAFRDPKHDQPLPMRQRARVTTRKPGLLVVDDNAAVLNVLDGALWCHGFLVWVAGTGQNALTIYRKLSEDIDMVLLDVRMPELDGPATLTALQLINPNVLCCFMSGDPGSYTEEELLERGAMLVFQKPFHVDEVADRIWQLLNAPGSESAWQRESVRIGS